jgi:phytoene synthase
MTQSDAAHCRQIVRRHARTFWLASHFLTPARRRAEYRADLDAALRGSPRGPVFRELALAAATYAVPADVLHELLDGVTRDCAPVAYATWPELALYCKGVASSVGEMCTHVFGVDGDDAVRDRALRHARLLGLAMQLTNILRDVGEDARHGRCYLPADELARYGLSPAEVLAGGLAGDARWRAFMTFQVARARNLYEQALPGIALLAADSRRCAMACAVGYAGILAAIERNEYDTFSTRARLGTVARAGVLWASWRGTRTLPAVIGTGDSREGEIMRWA